ILYRRDLLDEYGLDLPTTPDELIALGEEVNDPDNNRWAFGDFTLTARQLFGAPSEWRYECGELMHMFETDAWRASVEFMHRIYHADLVHPDIDAHSANAKELINPVQILFNHAGIGAWHDAYGQMLGDDSDFRLDLV